MRNVILIELANRWAHEAETPECQDGSPEAKIGNAKQKGAREAKRECADGLRMLVKILGDNVGS